MLKSASTCKQGGLGNNKQAQPNFLVKWVEMTKTKRLATCCTHGFLLGIISVGH